MIGIFKKPAPPRRQGDSHLVIRTPDRVGELIQATPILEAAVWDTRWPRVTILHPPELATLLQDGPLEAHASAWPTRRTRAYFESLGADAMLLLGGPLSLARFARSVAIPVRAGLGGDLQRHWLTHRVEPPLDEGRPTALPVAHTFRDLGGLVGLWPTNLAPRLYVSAVRDEDARASLAEAGLELGRPFALCAPTAERGPAADWPAASFAQVLDRLSDERGFASVVAVDADDEKLGRAVVDACERPAHLVVEPTPGYGRRKALARAASLALSSGAGMAWCAAAFGTPSVALFGPDPQELAQTSFAPLETVALEGLECAPCAAWSCPLKHHRCMRELGPGQVIAAADRALERRTSA